MENKHLEAFKAIYDLGMHDAMKQRDQEDGIRRTLEAAAKKLSQEFRVVTAKRILIDIIHDLGYTVNDSGRDMIRVFAKTDPETGFAPLLTIIKFGELHD